jgi:hypothetical protein
MSTSLRQNNCGYFKLACLTLLSGMANAQISQTGRFEIPLQQDETVDSYTVVSAQEEGLVVYDLLKTKKKSFIHISRIDTALQEVWNGSIEIDNNFTPRRAVVRQSSLYLLCKHTTRSTFMLLIVNLETKNFSIHTITNFIPFNPTDFISLGESVMIGGYFNYRPFVLHYSITTGKSKILPGFFNEQGELLQLRADENGMVDIIVSAKNPERKKSLWLRNYDADGTLVKTTIIEPDHDKNLIFGRSVKGSDDDQVVAGVYGRDTQIARGLFVAHINNYGEYNIQYYNFGDLQNFFSYMKASREKRVKDRIERRKIKGKKIRYSYRFLVHELIPYGDQFVMLGEAFYPQYKSTGPSGASLYGSNNFFYRGNYRDYNFDGYQYTHAVVIGFSNTGKLLWDNSFEINDVKTFNLEQFVKIQPKKGHINLLYLYNNLIRSKIIKDSQVLEGKTTEPIKTNFASDVASKEVNGKNKLEYWYPGVFYAFGMQRITNTLQPGTPLTRNVFYINKIVNH